jgi:hypothetical protein
MGQVILSEAREIGEAAACLGGFDAMQLLDQLVARCAPLPHCDMRQRGCFLRGWA